MTTLLEQAFTAATKLTKERQDQLAQLILQEISRPQYQVNKAPTQKSPLQIFTELGLVGCIEGEPDLSTNYKSVVKSYILKKHDHS
ncbi:CopG family transcriptional regulator [Pseudanabaena sp. UWO311]|uniref:CopG family transcriptional regulator n=1 Tax=Pseudanabaena sp. UWO311 TaxID=2487337 RepID=UPI00115BA6A7|nr:CopG family transcriptional regulator [Pseudanabaena sp. UWO311]TYQ27620.1 CopG family transcriptional regulator [Pseudanabaena sp. UWO311]